MLSEPEIWRHVPSIPGVMASSWGRVQVLPYEQKMPYGGSRTRSVAPTYGVWNKLDLRWQLTFKRKVYKVHQLVCEAFNGPKPFPRAVVMHDDEDSSHNWPTNLIWGTQKQNLNYPGFKAGAADRMRLRMHARMQIAA
jgi:hypothetical protein